MTGPSVVDLAREWFVRERPIFERFSESVRATLESLISQAGIEYLSVTSRVKDPESFAEKIVRKGYRNPQRQMTDIVGLRVIAYIESDVNRACDLIRSAFRVHKDKSLDKKSELGKDRFGYRSIHFVCDLGPRRLALPENQAYRGRVFEVQVRTVLQHAWAEIHHDRGYKFAGKLPEGIERRLYLQAALLEQVDTEFNRLAKELDTYAHDVAERAERGDLDEEITTAGLVSLVRAVSPRFHRTRILVPDDPRHYDDVLLELRDFGLTTLADVEKLFDEHLIRAEDKHEAETTAAGALRNAMMFADIDKYFDKAFHHRWDGMDEPSIAVLNEKYDSAQVWRWLAEHRVDVLDANENLVYSHDEAEEWEELSNSAGGTEGGGDSASVDLDMDLAGGERAGSAGE